jgi:hypothetical protein
VQILLKLNRPDLAVNELSAMQQINDLAVPTLLSQAWVGLAYVRPVFLIKHPNPPIEIMRLTFLFVKHLGWRQNQRIFEYLPGFDR